MDSRLPRHAVRAACLAGATLCILSANAHADDASAPAARSFAMQAGETVRDAAVSAWHSAENLTAAALSLIGIRYRWGGATPDAGLDCSGLVQFVFQQATGVTLPRSAKEMSRLGDKVRLDDLRPGDLVFFNTRRFAFSHVGIYLGDNRFIHAPRRGREVEVATIDAGYWQKHFDGARRLLGVLPELVLPALVREATAAPLEAEAARTPPAEAAPEP